VERYTDLFRQEVSERQLERERPELGEQVRKIVHAMRGQTLRQIFTELSGRNINGKHSISNQSFPMCKLLRYMRKLGFLVSVDNGAQRVSPIA